MKFEPLTVLTFTPVDSVEPVKLLVFGAEPSTRTDGTSFLMVGGGFSSVCDIPLGSVVVDELGGKWLVRSEVVSGFHLRFIILEEEEAYARSVK